MKIRIEVDELADLVSEMKKALAPKPQEPGGVKVETMGVGIPDSDIPGITREIYTAKNPKEEVQF